MSQVLRSTLVILLTVATSNCAVTSKEEPKLGLGSLVRRKRRFFQCGRARHMLGVRREGSAEPKPQIRTSVSFTILNWSV